MKANSKGFMPPESPMSDQLISIFTLLTLLLAIILFGFPAISLAQQDNAGHTLPSSSTHRPNVALVLGGGGARGYAHVGVLEVLKKAGVPIDLIVGSSAGSVIGALFSDNKNAKKTASIMKKASFWDFADLGNFPHLSGLSDGRHFKQFLESNITSRDFKDLQIPLVTVSTDLTTGKVVVIDHGRITPAVTASAAIPGIVRPVRLYGHLLIDGSMANPIPVSIAKRYHPKLIIAVNISQELPKRLPKTALGIYQRAYHISWIALCKDSVKQADIVIRPPVGVVDTIDLNHKSQMIEAGRKATIAQLPSILRTLKQRHIKTHHESNTT